MFNFLLFLVIPPSDFIEIGTEFFVCSNVMKCLFVVSLLVATATVKSLIVTSKIVDGELAKLNAFPYQTALLSMNQASSFICGGSVISSTAVLTGEFKFNFEYFKHFSHH